MTTYLDELYLGAGFTSCTFGKLPGTSRSDVTIIDFNTAGLGANAASSLVQSSSACTYAGAGGLPGNFQMNPYGIIDIGGAHTFNIACPIQTDPSLKKLKINLE